MSGPANPATVVGRPMTAARARPGGQPAQWLVTFADLAAVLVAFFVLMFSMSEVDTDRWNGAVDALDRQFDLTREAEQPRPVAERNITQLIAEDGLDLGYLRRILAGHIAEQPILEGARLRESDGALIVTGNTGSLRGKPDFIGFSPTKASQRILAESLARELGPQGVHVAYVVIDAVIDMPFARRRRPPKPDEFFAKPDDLANEIFHIAHQPRSARSFLVELRPFGEPW